MSPLPPEHAVELKRLRDALYSTVEAVTVMGVSSWLESCG